MLVITADTENNIGEVNSVGILGLVGSRGQFELAGIIVAVGESCEIGEGSCDSDDLVVLVAVLVLVVGDNGEGVSELELEGLGVSSHVVVAEEVADGEGVVEVSGVGEDDDLGGGGSESSLCFSEVLCASAAVLEGGDVADPLSLLSEGGEQV